MRGAPLSDAD
jgi:hypothetical protein